MCGGLSHKPPPGAGSSGAAVNEERRPDARLPDITRRSLVGLAQGLAAGLLLFGLLAGRQARRTQVHLGVWLEAWAKGRLDWPGRTVVGMLALLLMLAGVIVQLAAGWNLLVEAGLKLGINIDKPERARKVGNEFTGQ